MTEQFVYITQNNVIQSELVMSLKIGNNYRASVNDWAELLEIASNSESGITHLKHLACNNSMQKELSLKNAYL